MQVDRSSVLLRKEGGVLRPDVPRPDAGARPATLAPLAGARVLVVEDEPDSRELICSLLERAGASVLCVASVAEAMEGVYHSFDPDVVLTDYSMPEADGFDLIRAFRAAPSSRAIAVPVVILSANGEREWRARALAAGAAEVLPKPFDPALLISCIVAAVASTGRSGPH
jgi:CheY-like chemotaxis protein